MAVYKSGNSADLLSINSISKSAKVTGYLTNGGIYDNLDQGVAYKASYGMVTTAAMNTVPLFVFQNGTSKTVIITSTDIEIACAGTAAATSIFSCTMVRQYNGVAISNGVTVSAIPINSAAAASTVTIYGQDPTGVTALSIIPSNTSRPILPFFSTLIPRTVTSKRVFLDIPAEIVINKGEMLAVMFGTTGIGAIGDSASVNIEWIEY